MGTRQVVTRRRVQRASRNKRKKKTLGQRMAKWALFGVLSFGAVGILSAAGVFWYYAKDLPPADQLRTREIAESTKIYDRTGKVLLYDIYGEERRTIIDFDEMPTVIRYATIALEDQDFYEHHGIKVKSIIRAALSQIFPHYFGRSSGGSTITQQLIKNTLLTSERSYERKLKEIILSLELERKFTKDEILELYLNVIPYGSNAYGIEAAARTFFGKHAKDLTLDEAALLASLPQQPSFYSPYGTRPERLERLRKRQAHALDQMARLGYITQEKADEAKKIDTLAKVVPNREKIKAPHFVMYIREYLERQYKLDEVKEMGLRVITTLDWDLQQLAERVVRDGAERNRKRYNAKNAALVAIDPKTGQLLAMVGSADFFDKDIDGQVNVALRFRQPGSSFKPYVFLGMFRRGYVPDTVLYDVKTKFDGGDKAYEPQNYDGTFRGPVKIKKALGMSLNIPAVKALYLVGVDEVIELGKELGLTGLDEPKRYGLSLVLGGGEVQLLHHTHAYATLANGGVRKDLTSIMRIEDKDGNVLEEFRDRDGERVVEEKYVALLSDILSKNKYRAPAFGQNNPLRFDERSVAAKTGTTNGYRDAWTMGYTPSLAAGVWVGNNDNRAMRVGAAGSVVAAPIWHAFMEEALKDTLVEHFPDPSDEGGAGKNEEEKSERPLLYGKVPELHEKKVCRISKKDNTWCLASDACENNDVDVKRRKFIDTHSILHYVDKSDPMGDPPQKPEKDPQYKSWEKGVKKWYEEKDRKIVVGPVPTEKCKDSDFE